MGIDQIALEALKLSAEERAQLASRLWESLAAESPGQVTDQEAAKLALARDAELDSGLAQPISHEALMKRLRSREWSTTRRWRGT